MPYQVNLHDAKNPALGPPHAGGSGEEVVVSHANKPIARLFPYTQPKAQRRLGEAKGLIEIKPDFDQLSDEFMAHFT